VPNIRSIRMLASIAVAALLASAEVGAHAAEVSYKYATVDNIKIFYREAGGERRTKDAIALNQYDSGASR
jgi:hypothetical protein